VNLDNYDMILGTPFLYQHQVAIGFNPSRVLVGSSEPMEMKGPEVVTLNSAAMDVVNEGLKDLRRQLKEEAEDLCPDTSKTALPPLREVNHIIPIIDEGKYIDFDRRNAPRHSGNSGPTRRKRTLIPEGGSMPPDVMRSHY
jgi:hypothetical protein